MYEPILRALNERDVRCVVVGGVAVVLHGYARLTADLDLAVDLESDQARAAMEVLSSIGLTPTAPVDPIDFADPEIRALWVRDKGMKVFSMRDPGDPMRVVDVFVENPVAFEDLWARAVVMRLGETPVRVASIDDLVAMKRAVGRPQDMSDVEALEEIQRRGEHDG
jgi:hypothetical protein